MRKYCLLCKHLSILLLAILFSSSAYSQTMMPLPNHSSVYSGSARGYWFVAPVNFTIVGLRVPSQAGTGLQYIQVMRLGTTPPVAFTAQSSNFTNLAYISGATNGVIQTVNIQVNAGDVIGILGTAGTGNSYATGGYATNINGQAVTLTRFGYQGNINTGAAPVYWGEGVGNTGSISRVEMYYTVGPPCGGVNNLSINNVNSVAASFSWTTPTSTQGYEYAVTQTAASPTTGVTATTNTFGSATGLTPATQYFLQVRNQCQSGSWSQWDTLSFTTLDSCHTPRGFAVYYVDSNSANIGWSPVLTANSYDFIINQSRATPTTASGSTNTTNNTLSLTGLTEGTTYYIHVRSLCNGNDSSGWMLDSFYVPVPCRAPIVNITNINTNQGVASWAAVNTAVGYEYVLNEDPNPPALGTAWANTSFLLPYLDDGKTYYMHVRSHCNDKGVITSSKWGVVGFETTPVGISVLGIDKRIINAYPNPVTEVLQVNIEGRLAKGAVLELVDVTGRVVMSKVMNVNKTTLDMSGMASGVYLLRCSDDQEVSVIKITKR